ncbi:histone methyltransferase set2 [Apophysomyces ossiformis]|uniref:Histone methyltransferase set2 n=1 Tax=Apophysomyces ossiformis TaxID=679940 RepID=A0A8H7BZJ4_9FUNG|nr:histone methyltransferase set2 [Apophysomyces ossiformis]
MEDFPLWAVLDTRNLIKGAAFLSLQTTGKVDGFHSGITTSVSQQKGFMRDLGEKDDPDDAQRTNGTTADNGPKGHFKLKVPAARKNEDTDSEIEVVDEDDVNDNTDYIDVVGNSPGSVNMNIEINVVPVKKERKLSGENQEGILLAKEEDTPNFPEQFVKYGSKRPPSQQTGSPQEVETLKLSSEVGSAEEAKMEDNIETQLATTSIDDEAREACSLPLDLPSATSEAMQTYENITANIYCGTATGRSIAEESMPCECKYDPDDDEPSAACGRDEICINRMMFMECVVDDCPCGRYCRNRRFQLCQYARVDVINADKKGYGLRALTDLPKNAFIMEYIGEVIPNNEFIRRTRKYENEGLKHYYFMTLKTDEIIDATKKGCLARFINHSCNPNCVTQKWVIGKKMRIGIFTSREVKAGQELTFDYKFERYGAVAQKCYCGEPNCKGYIGGTVEKDTDEELLTAPRIQSTDDEDDMDSYESTLPMQKKAMKKRNKQPQPLQDVDEVQMFVKKMLDSVGKAHLVNKLLLRLELTNPDNSTGREILKKFVRLHGLKMLKFWLGEWKHDEEIVIKYVESKAAETRESVEDSKPCDASTSDMLPSKKIRFNSSREFFDPDDDYFEYLSLDVTAEEIEWKTRYPPRPIIPSAPKAMLDYAAKDPYYTYYHDYGNSYLARDTNTASSAIACVNKEQTDAYEFLQANDVNSQYAQPFDPYASYYASAYRDGSYMTTPAGTDGKKLPANWRSAITEEGVIYYYNIITRKSQWQYPEEKASSIEGVDREQIDGLVEMAILESEKKKQRQASSSSPAMSTASKNGRSPQHSMTPTASTSGSTDALSIGEDGSAGAYLNEIDLKREVGKVVTKYLSAKQQSLWNGDKHLFKELARKITHHIVDREVHSGRKIRAITSPLRIKIEKFIDSHGNEIVAKLNRQKKVATSSSLSSMTR